MEGSGSVLAAHAAYGARQGRVYVACRVVGGRCVPEEENIIVSYVTLEFRKEGAIPVPVAMNTRRRVSGVVARVSEVPVLRRNCPRGSSMSTVSPAVTWLAHAAPSPRVRTSMSRRTAWRFAGERIGAPLEGCDSHERYWPACHRRVWADGV